MRTIFFYGDSNTYGFDPRNGYGGRYTEEVRWTERLKADRELPWNILVNAMNGREIPAGENGYLRVEEKIRQIQEKEGKLDWFAVMLGTNDLLGARAEYAVAKMDAFLRRLLERVQGVRVLLIAPPAVGSRESADPEMRWFEQESRHMNLQFHILAEQYKLEYINAADWELPMAFDEVHLSEEGHRLFALHMKEWLAAHQD